MTEGETWAVIKYHAEILRNWDWYDTDSELALKHSARIVELVKSLPAAPELEQAAQ